MVNSRQARVTAVTSPASASPGSVPHGTTFSTKWPTIRREIVRTSRRCVDAGRPETIRSGSAVGGGVIEIPSARVTQRFNLTAIACSLGGAGVRFVILDERSDGPL
ncbi:Uncharacterised protein [Mycobacteroides abscessus subsp. abscessus]|nr:Uncharacterised protein [Mycobacteroides abscessus subsp. abscessus]